MPVLSPLSQLAERPQERAGDLRNRYQLVEIPVAAEVGILGPGSEGRGSVVTQTGTQKGKVLAWGAGFLKEGQHRPGSAGS